MKNFLRFGFLIALLSISGWGYAQSTVDFEIVGNDWAWNAFENGANTDGSFTIEANPDATGINTSATCGMLTVNTDAARWAGAENKHGEDHVPFIFDADNSSITIMVYKSVISPVGLKFAENNGEAQLETKVSNTKINEWEELTFDLSGSIGAGITGIIDQIIVFPDFPDGDRVAGSICYVDNIKFGTGAPSIDYSKIGFTVVSAGGDKILNLGTAIAWTAASDQTWLTLSAASGTGDAAITMTASANTSTSPRTATVTITGGDATTQAITVTQEGETVVFELTSAPTPPTRNEIDVISIFSDAYTPVTATFQDWWGTTITEETVGVTTDAVKKVSSECCFGYEFASTQDMSTMTKLHIDIYPTTVTSMNIGVVANGDHKKLITLTPDTWNSIDILLSDLTTVENLASVAQTGFWDIMGAFYMDNLYFYNEAVASDTEDPTAFSAIAGTITSESVELLLNATDNSGAISYTISYGDGPTVLTTSGTSEVEEAYVVTGLTASTAYSFSVTAEDAAGNTAANNPVVVTATTLDAAPAVTEAPTPTVEASKVLSIYSDAYTNVEGTNFAPGWGQSTQSTEIQLGSSNNTLEYTSFNYMGIELAASIDASEMTSLHLDIYPVDETSISITPISSGPAEFAYALTLVQGEWNSYDIPLTSFTGVDMADIFQFKFDGGTGNSFYMDNLYLYDNATGINTSINSTITIYPNPVSSILFIEGLTTNATIKIFDLGGKLMVEKLDIDHAINVDQLTKGIYFVQISDENSITMRKFIKE